MDLLVGFIGLISNIIGLDLLFGLNLKTSNTESICVTSLSQSLSDNTITDVDLFALFVVELLLLLELELIKCICDGLEFG